MRSAGSQLQTAVTAAWQLRNTRWAFPRARLVILSDYILEGVQWMVRGKDTAPSTMDRVATRKGSLKVDLLPVLERWRSLEPPRGGEIDSLMARLKGEGHPLEGFRHFSAADFTVYHRPRFSFFLKTVSDRTLLTETLNGENLLGSDLSTGDHYYLTDASNYLDLPPGWDWERLPGVTRSEKSTNIQRSGVAGGVGDDRSGMAAMDYVRGGDDEANLVVRRMWTFHKDWVIGLFGGWQAGAKERGSPYTTLDQRPLRGHVVVGLESGKTVVLETGDHAFAGVRYLWHDGVAYVMLNPSTIQLRLSKVSGSWNRINRNYGIEAMSKDIFLAAIEHGRDPTSGGFVIAPASGVDEVEGWLGRKRWAILRNDRTCQAIQFDDGTGMAAFYHAGSLGTAAGSELSVDRPVLAFWRGADLHLTDPTHEGGAGTVDWRGREYRIVYPRGGRAASTSHHPEPDSMHGDPIL